MGAFPLFAALTVVLVLLLLPVCSPADDVSTDAAEGMGACSAGDGSSTCSVGQPVKGAAAAPPKTISVVLPCAGEGEFALSTVKAVYSSTPAHVLHEIVVVDDGSTPALSKSILTKKVRNKYGVRVIRHSQTEGLIRSKKHGGDAALGDVVVFFDCHVAPQEDWYRSFLRLIGENYRRIVVPVITDLDIDTWTQSKRSNSNDKCYLSLDADFKWFESQDDFVPVLSGGLLGISKRWWNETGGYDEDMYGWGGENIDQSLRSWLCGGEIMNARDSFVAHMWRKAEDPRTESNYDVHPMHPMRNRLRAALAWYGAFERKLAHFPHYYLHMKDRNGGPWYGSVDSIKAVSKRLQCKPLAWYFHRFKTIYKDGGVIPNRTFTLRFGAHGQCLTFQGPAGTNPAGRGEAVLRPCAENDDRQRWHGANHNLQKSNMGCCSGLRAWNTDQCIESTSNGAVQLYTCAIAGHHHGQQWKFEKGRLRRHIRRYGIDECIEGNSETGALETKPCRAKAGETAWSRHNSTEPLEEQIYREQLNLLQA